MVFKSFILTLSPREMEVEFNKQFKEQFDNEDKSEPLNHFVRTKIIFEHISSFHKISEPSWNTIFDKLKILKTYPSAKYLYENMNADIYTKLLELNSATNLFLKLISTSYTCSIIGSSPSDPNYLVSNLFYDHELTYDFLQLIPSEPLTEKPEMKAGQSVAVARNPIPTKKPESAYHHTEIKGTKEWNQNDAYILFLKKADLHIEQKKFYSSSFVTLNPSENININLAAALIRKNSGQGMAPKYTKMIQTLLDFIINNLFLKDFPYVTDDLHTFLYHIGPVVIYNIIVEDMNRRDFGFCHYVEGNRIIKFFPDIILRKHIIDYWADKFFDLRSESVDGYIHYSKGISNIKESYKNFFDFAASTRKRGDAEKSLDNYMKENVGKFFGYRRAQVFKRFIPDSIFGFMSEVNSTELIKKFK